MIFARMEESNVVFYNSMFNYPEGIPNDCIPITQEQQDEFYAKGMRHKIIDGFWTYVEPTEPTAEEIKQQKIDVLDAEYQPQFDALSLAWATASMDSNTTLADSIKADKATLQAEYNTKREAIVNG